MSYTVVGAAMLWLAAATAVTLRMLNLYSWGVGWPLLLVAIIGALILMYGVDSAPARYDAAHLYIGAALIASAAAGVIVLNLDGAYTAGFGWAMAGVGAAGLGTVVFSLDTDA